MLPIQKILSIGLVGFMLTFGASCGERPSPSTAGSDSGGDTSAGGDGDGGAIVYGPNGEVIGGDPDLGAALATALTLHVISDANTISTGGTDVANIKVLVTDDSNRAKPEQEIEFASSGGVLQNIISVTDINGEASAVLTLGRDFRNQDIMVEAQAGGTVGTVQITTDGTDVSVAGEDLLVAGDTAELVVSLTAGNGEPISNEEVTFTSTAGNTITPASGFTNSDGQISIEVDSASGSDIVTVSALEGTVTATHEITVANDILTFESPTKDQEVAVGLTETVQVVWESNGVPVANQDLRFALTAGQILGGSVVTTDSAGRASVDITSNSAGPARVTVESDATGDPAAKLDFEFIATTPAEVTLKASATRVPTGETSTLTALVTDANGNPVKNTEVVFSSPDLRGGQLNPASAMSNSDGEASVSFTAGRLATEYEAIQILSQVVNTTIVDDVLLTAVDRVLNVTIGTTDLIRTINGETQYSLPFVVQVADGGGAPLEGATVEMSIRPLSYAKGHYRAVNAEGILPENYAAANPGGVWTASDWALIPTVNYITCNAEDANGNRLLDPGEDFNNNGSLDPQDPAIVAADSENTPTIEGGAITTDATGSGFFGVIYPQSNAHWATIEITARAKALGAEAEASFYTDLPVLADEINDMNSSMPNHHSPYGVTLDCSNTL